MVDRGELDEGARGWTIGGVRILAGLLWLANLHWKVPPDFGQNNNGGLYKYIASGADHAPFAPYRWALREIVLPNFQFFGWLTLILEIALAALLLVGYRTRIVALVAVVQSAFIGLSVIYYERSYEWSWSYLLMIGVHMLLWATLAGEHLGVDGVRRAPERSPLALRTVGIVGVAVGVLGLIVARSVDFAGRQAALLGSDAGFVSNGTVERRWELKLLFFNPLWALLTIAFAALLIVGSRAVAAAWAGAAGFAVIAVIAFASKTFQYARDDGASQTVSTGPNVAFWAALAVAGASFAWYQRSASTRSTAPSSTSVRASTTVG